MSGHGIGAPRLRVSGLRVAYGDGGRGGGEHLAVDGVDLDVHAGETVAVVGQSGSGKTTVAMAVLGLLPAGARVVDGTIELDGRDITRLPDAERRRVLGAQIGYVPQDPTTNLDPLQRVGDAVAEALAVHRPGGSRGADRPRGDGREDVLDRLRSAGFPDPAAIARRYPHELSGGQRQRVLIAIALACRPGLTIADEPTSALDVTTQRQVLELLTQRTEEIRSGTLLITHDLAIAAERADRLLVLHDGKVVESGTPSELWTDPHHEYTRRLLEAAPTLGQRRLIGDTEPTAPAAPNAAASAGTDAAAGRPGPAEPAPQLVASGLEVAYRSVRVLHDVSLALHPGRTLGLVGESGSGKTTTARVLLRLQRPTAGEVSFRRTQVLGLRGRALRDYRRSVQPVFQNPFTSLDPSYSIARTLDEALRLAGDGDRSTRRARADELLEQVALPTALRDRLPRELSGGQQQRVAIARALAFDPAVIVCDEAVSALDVLVQQQILELLVDIQRRTGVSYLFVSHDLAVVRLISHEVAVMREGRIVEHGPTERIFAQPGDDYTAALLAAIPAGAGPAEGDA